MSDQGCIDRLTALENRAEKGQPKVSRAFIRQLAGELSTYNFTDKHPCEVSALLTKRFIEAGVGVEEE